VRAIEREVHHPRIAAVALEVLDDLVDHEERVVVLGGDREGQGGGAAFLPLEPFLLAGVEVPLGVRPGSGPS
jgi:hypothetical protein